MHIGVFSMDNTHTYDCNFHVQHTCMDLRVFFMDCKYECEDIFMHNTHIVGCREIPSRKFNMSAKLQSYKL